MPKTSQPLRSTIFVSYSHKDEAWLDLVVRHLEGLNTLEYDVEIWDDRQIQHGADWYQRIREVLARTRFAVCLVSPDFMASAFCQDEEVPYLLRERNRGGLEILPILVEPDENWKGHRWFRRLQMLPRDGRSLRELDEADRRKVLAGIAGELRTAIESGTPMFRRAPPPAGPAAERVDFTRLPGQDQLLLGRQKELRLLDKSWADPATRLVVFKAWGGVGKSTLVRAWVEDIQLDGFRGAERVYAWSFYSQGTGDRVVSADQFIAAALQFFGDPDPTAGSPWEKGERLARAVGTGRNLLLLDGLEPLQEGGRVRDLRGAIKDPALKTLLDELSRKNDGLCVITTREPVVDLLSADGEPVAGTVHQDLEQLSMVAGRALLRIAGVLGDGKALEAVVKDFGRHALALNLLSTWLAQRCDGDVGKAATVPDLPDVSDEDGRHARRVMEAWAATLGPGRETSVLRMLGLFDRPAERAALEAVLASPAIPGLTDPFFGGVLARLFSKADSASTRLDDCLAVLRKAGLVARASHCAPDLVDSHPLVREHFGDQLRREAIPAWREAQRRLYEFFRALPERDCPENLADMEPLLRAVAHGCTAGLHRRAFEEVYYSRIQRGGKVNFTCTQLGAYGADLAALSHFFEDPWLRPVAGMSKIQPGALQNFAGFRLRAIGRLEDAVEPSIASKTLAEKAEDWVNASAAAGNLSELLLRLGRLDEAEAVAREALVFAGRGGDGFHLAAMRTTIADALHGRGRFDEARTLFVEAEALMGNQDRRRRYLGSVMGSQYCDLLLSLGEYSEARLRAETTLPWNTEEHWLLDIALDYLTIGRAAFDDAVANPGPNADRRIAEARLNLDRAVNGLRHSGDLDELPRSLLARATLRRYLDQFDASQHDLDEARRIAVRGSMRLYLADVELESARLALARSDRATAGRHYEAARKMVQEMGYLRRQPELDELARQLEPEAPPAEGTHL